MIAMPPSIALYRTPHKIVLEVGADGLQRCRHCGIRCYSVVVPGHWLHDQAEIRRLREAEMLAAVAPETCLACARPIVKGSEDDFLAMLVGMPDGSLRLLCHVCQDRGAGL